LWFVGSAALEPNVWVGWYFLEVSMHYRRARQAGGVYFFTLTAHGRRPLLTQPRMLEALSLAVAHVKTNHPFAMPAFVILPDHLHVLWRLPELDHDFSTRWRLIKHFVTRHVSAQGKIWQSRFWEHLVRDEEDYRRHLDYIHINPVKHGLAARPGDWPHSSFGHYVDKGWYEPGWGVALPDFCGDFGE
jgi:putative transposase